MGCSDGGWPLSAHSRHRGMASSGCRSPDACVGGFCSPGFGSGDGLVVTACSLYFVTSRFGSCLSVVIGAVRRV